jgi:hypothetical protein
VAIVNLSVLRMEIHSVDVCLTYCSILMLVEFIWCNVANLRPRAARAKVASMPVVASAAVRCWGHSILNLVSITNNNLLVPPCLRAAGCPEASRREFESGLETRIASMASTPGGRYCSPGTAIAAARPRAGRVLPIWSQKKTGWEVKAKLVSTFYDQIVKTRAATGRAANDDARRVRFGSSSKFLLQYNKF